MELAKKLAVANKALDARDTKRARAVMEQLFAAYPDAAPVLWTAGRFLGLLGSYAEAAAQFKRAVQRDASFSHVEFEVAGKVVRLRDVPGSTWAADILREFSEGMYGITTLPFAPGDVVVDVGAHIGGVSVILAVLHPEIRIVSYEPSSSNYAMLCANLEANGITNVTAHQQAVMGEAGQLTLTWTPHATAGSTVGLSDAARARREAGGWQSEVVECVTLDDVFATHQIERCSWLKLDCETAEWGIMAKTGVLERIDRLSLELHLPASRQAEGPDRLIAEFVELASRVPNAPTTNIASIVWMTDV